MKRITLLFIAIIMAACSDDNESIVTAQTCTCNKIVYGLTYMPVAGDPAPTDSDLNVLNTVPDESTNCDDDGKLVFNLRQGNHDGSVTITKHKLDCNPN